jgi:hypothetical protein
MPVSRGDLRFRSRGRGSGIEDVRPHRTSRMMNQNPPPVFPLAKEPAETLSIHGVLGGVAVAGDHFDFLLFALLVFDFQRSAVRGNDLNF